MGGVKSRLPSLFLSVTANGGGSMGSSRDSVPGQNRARDATRQPWPSRVRPRPMSGIAPATPLPSPDAPARAAPKISSLIPTPPGVHPLGQQPKLLDRLREALRSRHYSPRTEQAYRHWVKPFIFFHDVRHPAEMAEPEINAFLWYKTSWATVTSRPQ
jgi:hypothetical protein